MMQQKNYRHTKDVLKYSAVYKKRRRAQSIKLGFFAFLLLCILIGLVFILRMQMFNISDVQVGGLQSFSTQDVVNEVNSQIDGSYAFILPRKNIFFYPKGQIEKDLLNKFSTFASVDIKIVDTNKIEISVTEKNAVAVDCPNEQVILDKTYTGCLFMDSNARTFQNVVGEPDQSLIRFIDSNLGSASSSISSSTINQVGRILSDLNSRNLIIQYVKVPDVKSIEFQVLNNGKIILATPVNDDLIGILDTALKTKPLSDNVAFEYIDVRFGNKVFFKLGNSKASSSLVTGSSTASTTFSVLSNSVSTSSIQKATSSISLIKKQNINLRSKAISSSTASSSAKTSSKSKKKKL